MSAYELSDKLSDEELALRAADGDSPAMERLLLRYSKTINAEASKYYVQGYEKEDIVQEGMIGLYSAVLNYKPERNSFKTFACLCITRRMLTLLKASARQKHIPLNAAFSLDGYVGGNEGLSFVDCLEAPESTNPEKVVLSNDAYLRRLSMIKASLSGFENRVLHYLLEGLTYKEISRCMHRDAKSVDNAIQRIRKKSAPISEF